MCLEIQCVQKPWLVVKTRLLMKTEGGFERQDRPLTGNGFTFVFLTA